jgi:hypothetical protein
MTRAGKPKRLVCAGLVINIAAFIAAQVSAVGKMETVGTGLPASFECRVAELRITLRNQPANQKSANGLALGFWGGQHSSLEVKPDGAIAEYDCAHGTISRKIILDRQGRFSVAGLYTPEHGGPVRGDQQPNSIPVQFSGRVRGERMSLIVKRRDSGKLIGSFDLVFGQEASLVKCR